jgi:NAD-dependent SIR2 family protein deacetylase
MWKKAKLNKTEQVYDENQLEAMFQIIEDQVGEKFLRILNMSLYKSFKSKFRKGNTFKEFLKNAYDGELSDDDELDYVENLSENGDLLQPSGDEKSPRNSIEEKDVSNAQEDPLIALGRILNNQAKLGEQRKIKKVITFNVDDLLEATANKQHLPNFRKSGTLKCTQSVLPATQEFADKNLIPIVHIHGLLPRRKCKRLFGSEIERNDIIFTFEDYRRVANDPEDVTHPANSHMKNTLQANSCIFIGLSMKDANLKRWIEQSAGKCRHTHYWITTAKNTDEFKNRVAELETVGVKTVLLEKHDQLASFLKTCFSDNKH